MTIPLFRAKHIWLMCVTSLVFRLVSVIGTFVSWRNLCTLGGGTAGRFRLPSCLITSFSDVSAVDDGEYHFYRFDLSCSLLEIYMTEISCVITLTLTTR